MSVCKSCGFRNPPGRRSCVKCSDVFRTGGGSGAKALGGVVMLLFVVAASAALFYKMSEPSNPARSGSLYENPTPASAVPKQKAAPTATKRPAPSTVARVKATPNPEANRPKKPFTQKARPPAIPQSQFESILKQASDHLAKLEYRRAYNLYKAAAGFQDLPEAAESKKDTAYAMWSLKEVVRDLSLRDSVDAAWASLTRSRLATLDYNSFPSEADKKKYLETMKKLEGLAAGGRGRSGSR